MATSVYFSPKVRTEQNLLEDIIIESLKIYGQDVYYLPRQITRDMVLNDVIESKFLDAYAIEMYIENVNGFEGDQSLMSKFGLEIRDQATFVVAKRTWEKLVGFWNNTVETDRPMEGDLLYYPLTNSFFEIKFVEHEQPFYQLNKVATYKLQCEKFEYSNEVVNTGIEEVDDLQRLNANAIVLSLNSQVGDAQFKVGETCYQQFSGGLTVSAEVLQVERVDAASIRLSVGNIQTSDGEYHEFTSGFAMYGQDSSARWVVSEVYGIGNVSYDGVFPESGQAQNRDFELAGDDIIDFSESNPFGDPSINYGGGYTPTPVTPKLSADMTNLRADSTIYTVDAQ